MDLDDFVGTFFCRDVALRLLTILVGVPCIAIAFDVIQTYFTDRTLFLHHLIEWFQ